MAFRRERRPGRDAGFTLIEIVGAFFMMVVILVFVTGIFVENGRQRSAATGLMRERLSAVAALDLMARDLEGTVFLSPETGEDPDLHPWHILAARPGEFGATAIRFVTQNAPGGRSAEHASNWVEVTYFLEEDADGERVLWRWQSPRPPSEPTRGFPDSADPDSARIAVDVHEFGLRFLDASGNWVEEWDSTYQPAESAIPEAMEISLVLLREARRGEALEDDQDGRVPGMLHTRRVATVMRPIDVAALIDLARGGDGALDCFTIGQCVAEGDDAWFGEELTSNCGGDDALCAMLESADDHCWSEIETTYPAVAARAPASCSS